MPKILGFKADIINVKYVKYENKNEKIKAVDPLIYVCNAQIKEIGQGLANASRYHQVQIYLTEEDFNNRALEKGDRIQILDGATWVPVGKTDYITYAPAKIATYDKSQLKVDDKGRTYAKTTIYPYTIRVKADQFKILYKWYDKNYCTITESRIKLPLESFFQFKKDKEIAFFLDEDEYNKLLPYNGEIVNVICYSTGQRKAEKQMETFMAFDETNNAYILTLRALEKDEIPTNEEMI